MPINQFAAMVDGNYKQPMGKPMHSRNTVAIGEVSSNEEKVIRILYHNLNCKQISRNINIFIANDKYRLENWYWKPFK